MENQRYLKIIRADPFFEKLDVEMCQKLIEQGSCHEINAGEYLMRQGDLGNSMYVILSGRFAVLVDDPQLEKRQVAEISTSQIVGEWALLTQDRRSASIQAITKGHVLEITQKTFSEVVGPTYNALHQLLNQSVFRLKGNFSGWFASGNGNARVPSFWRQSAVVLLTIFPTVVICNYTWIPLLQNYPTIPVIFISCVVTVLLTSWPLIPAAMKVLYWWILPEGNQTARQQARDLAIILILYLVEIAILWEFYNFFIV
jgi:hypothetical protein